MIVDPLGDMLTRIRNAQMRGRGRVFVPASSLRGRVLSVLRAEGYIRDFSRVSDVSGRSGFEIELKYLGDLPVIRRISRVSKPGRRVYVSVKDVPLVFGGLGVAILSTSKGVMADREARSNNVGGEVLCQVF